MNMEMEIEDLKTMVDLLKSNEDQFILVGQLNHISETGIRMELIVSAKADYDGEAVLVTYREQIATESLPFNENDTIAKGKIEEAEKTLQTRKEQIKQQLINEKFAVEFGVWKTLE